MRETIPPGSFGTSLSDAYTRSMEVTADAAEAAESAVYLRQMKEILDAAPMKGPPGEAIEICRHVFIGSQRNADDLTGLRRLGITHVLNCAASKRFDLRRSPYASSGSGASIEGYMAISADDHEDYNIAGNFAVALAFLDSVKAADGKALVHCNLGINRSGAICAAYLMHDQKMSLLEAVRYLKMKRSVVLCNRGFRKQLVQYARTIGTLDNGGEEYGSGSMEFQSTSSSSSVRSWRNTGDDQLRSNDYRSSGTESHQEQRYTASYRSGSSRNRSLSPMSAQQRSEPAGPATNVSASTRRSPVARTDSAAENYEDPIKRPRLPTYRSQSTLLDPIHEGLSSASQAKRSGGSGGMFSRLLSSSSTSSTTSVAVSQRSSHVASTISKTSMLANQPEVGFRRKTESISDDFCIQPIEHPQADDRFWNVLSRHASVSTDSVQRAGAGILGSEVGSEDMQLSSSSSACRPLKIYQRSATDSQMYQKPTATTRTYRRSETTPSAALTKALGSLRIDSNQVPTRTESLGCEPRGYEVEKRQENQLNPGTTSYGRTPNIRQMSSATSGGHSTLPRISAGRETVASSLPPIAVAAVQRRYSASSLFERFRFDSRKKQSTAVRAIPEI